MLAATRPRQAQAMHRNIEMFQSSTKYSLNSIANKLVETEMICLSFFLGFKIKLFLLNHRAACRLQKIYAPAAKTSLLLLVDWKRTLHFYWTQCLETLHVVLTKYNMGSTARESRAISSRPGSDDR